MMTSQDQLPFVIQKISDYQYPGKKALQKLIYLMERKGLNLGFNYSIHYYGPYSSDLDDAIHSLEMQGVIEIKYEGQTHKIVPTELLETEKNIITTQESKIIDTVLKTYANMTAHELELLTTTDYVAGELCRQGSSCQDEAIIDGVTVIKGQKFSADQIAKAIQQLKTNGYSWN